MAQELMECLQPLFILFCRFIFHLAVYLLYPAGQEGIKFSRIKILVAELEKIGLHYLFDQLNQQNSSRIRKLVAEEFTITAA